MAKAMSISLCQNQSTFGTDRVVAHVVPKDMFVKKNFFFFWTSLRVPARGFKFKKRPFFCDFYNFLKPEQGP